MSPAPSYEPRTRTRSVLVPSVRVAFAPMVSSVGCLAALLLAVPSAHCSANEAVHPPQPVTPTAGPAEFNRDVRPILAESCFQCHGPDARARQADLRLDVAGEATRDRGGHAAIVPGQPGDSAVVARITAEDAAERMPPPDSQRTLSPAQVATLVRWIEQGAAYELHWSLVPPRRADPPAVTNDAWSRNAIDRFVLAKLVERGWQPSPEADRETLIRRVTLDLTGLPPTLGEIDAFLLDNTPGAYERVVARLLASPRYGERMAVPWLDAARYADTNGYQEDGTRHMWRWRDWVIEAFNRNLPFDQFTIEQLAGDLLPGASLDQLIATGFNRNHRTNSERGIIAEEYLLEYAVDRVDTTATVWLGMTLACARCHDHKFDPVTQREFYQLLAYFNNVPETGRAVGQDNSPPLVRAPPRDLQERIAAAASAAAAAEAEVTHVEASLPAAQVEWEASVDRAARIDWSYDEGLVARLPLDGSAATAVAGQAVSRFVDGEGRFALGVLDQALELDGKCYLEAGDLADFNESQRFSLAAWVRPGPGRSGTILARYDAQKTQGYALRLAEGKLQVYFGRHPELDSIDLETIAPLAAERWQHVVVTFGGVRTADGVRLYVDGRPAELTVRANNFSTSFRVAQPLRIGWDGAGARFSGAVDDVRWYNRALSPPEVQIVACGDAISAIVAVPPAQRSATQQAKLRAYFVAEISPPHARAAYDRLREARRDRQQLEDSAPTVMVMREHDPPRPTYLLARGEYDKPGERVERGLPANIPPQRAATPANRLELARWLVDPRHPLTARVTVNRFWQMYFGRGLVATTEDVGAQGEAPSHPELLDWLATEFVCTGWDVKALQRLIVESATYRQAARVSAAQASADPDNRLLGRGPRFRLPAGTIRDVALAAAGLLVDRVGGTSVKPYQPPGLWEELTAAKYSQDHGDALYRRSLYTFWKRTIAPPTMLLFDAPSRETCIVRPMRTNTPLQALAVLNDVTYVEAARGLAQRMLVEAGPETRDRITYAFRLATGRRPTAAELRVLSAGLEAQRARYAADPAAAEKLVAVGEAAYNQQLPAADLAAYTNLAGVILNLDETMTKE